MSKRAVVYGASGHGKVLADVVMADGRWELLGFVDDGRTPADGPVLGLPILGGWDWLRDQTDVAVVLAIGVNRVREAIAKRCKEAGLALVTAVHPRAVVSPSATIEEGAAIMAGALVNPDARVGAGAIVNTGAVVEHDVDVGAFAHLSPNATTGGGVAIGARSHLGVGSAVIPLVRIGADTVVGAGAVVLRDLPDGVVAVGVPAKIIKDDVG